jgi:hypothetical protein
MSRGAGRRQLKADFWQGIKSLGRRRSARTQKYQKPAQNARRQIEKALMAAVNKKPEECGSREEVQVTESVQCSH